MKKLSLLLALLTLIACGKKKTDTKKTVALSEEDIAVLMQNQNFTCASLDGGECPDGVARVFVLNVADPNQSALCAGFLTAANRLVTNHHCLSTEEMCRTTFVAVHRQGSFEQARCQRIIRTLSDEEPLGRKTLDVTVMELDQALTAEPLSLTTQPPPNGSGVSAWVVDHIDLFTGRITELDCELENSERALEFSQCPAISGNSGSSMINSQGQVIGVLWGSTLDPSFTESIDLETRRALPAFSIATGVRFFRSFSLP